jgi:hypothetical protein
MPYVLMAVPAELVDQVARLIEGAAEDKPAKDTAPDLLNGWTEETVREHYRASSENMQGFLVYLAQNADDEVTSDNAAKELGLQDWNSIAGVLGAAHRRAVNHYGLEEPPWKQRWTYDEGRRRFKMPPNIAAIILDEAGE